MWYGGERAGCLPGPLRARCFLIERRPSLAGRAPLRCRASTPRSPSAARTSPSGSAATQSAGPWFEAGGPVRVFARLESGTAVHDQDRALAVRGHRGRDAPDEDSREPGDSVRAKHDHARVVLIGNLRYRLPRRRAFDAALSARKPAVFASEAPSAAVCSAAARTSPIWAASNSQPARRNEPDVERLPHG